MTVPKVVFALYLSLEARERVCRWAQWMLARSFNDCFDGRLFPSFSMIGATATAGFFKKACFAVVLVFREVPFSFRTSHLLTHVAHNPIFWSFTPYHILFLMILWRTHISL
jgi:hypothetical protein